MRTKSQKSKDIESGVQNLTTSETVIVTNFTGLSANDMNALRKKVKEISGRVQVMKKRLLKFVFENRGMQFDPKQFNGQVSVVFSPKDIGETAALVSAFKKEHKDKFEVLGGWNVSEKLFLEKELVEKIGNLPPRPILLGQLVGMIAAPIRSFLFVLNEQSKKIN